MITWIAVLAAALGPSSPENPTPTAAGAQTVVVVVGAPGEPQFALEFHRWAEQWRQVAEQGPNTFHEIGRGAETTTSDRDTLQQLLRDCLTDQVTPLWLVLLGHGTFDGQRANFNLRGPDVSASELAAWLKDCRRPLVVVNCSSSSSPFLAALAGPQRVVITATRSGYEQNFARFGGFLAAAIADPAADLDKDGQTSLLEAYLMAARNVAAFYEQEGRLTTEHPLLEDTGDGRGTPASFYRGIRAHRVAKDGATLDGAAAHQIHLLPTGTELSLSAEVRQARRQLEAQLDALRARKTELDEDAYYGQLEELLVLLARIHDPPPSK